MQSDRIVADVGNSSSSASAHARKGFLLNVVSNIANMVFQTVVALWLTPYLIANLGVAVYGMLPLVTSVTAYVQVFTVSFNEAVSRFLMIDLNRGDKESANRTFNSALFGTVGIIAILILPVLVLTLSFPRVFNVPGGSKMDTQWLFALICGAFFLSLITSIFAVSTRVYSQFFLENVIKVGGLIVRIGLIILLFSAFSARLSHVGLGTLVMAVIAFAGYYVLWLKFTPELDVRIDAFDRTRLRPLLGMGGWVVVDRVGGLLLKRVDLIVVNIVFGAVMTGRYGSILQFPTLISLLAVAASGVIHPITMAKFAEGDLAALRRLSTQAVKLLGFMLALPVGLLCGFAFPFLSIWLGTDFSDLNTLMILVIAHLTLNLAAMPLGYVQTAMNRVRWPGVATLISGVANLGLAFLLARYGPWGVLGVAIAGATVWTAKNTLFFPIFTARILNAPWWTFLPSLGTGLVATAFVGLAAYGTTLLHVPDNWFSLGLSAVYVSAVYGVLLYFIGLRKDDWRLIYRLSPRVLQRRLRWLLKKTHNLTWTA
jgi:O-antigen/teichoic acid export membrane protein